MRLSDAMRFGCAVAAAFTAGILLATPPRIASIAEGSPDPRKMAMRFTWNECQPDCRGWVAAQGIVTADTPDAFEDFAKNRNLSGVAIVLDSGGGSVNDAITLGRRFRKLDALTSVGALREAGPGGAAAIDHAAACESMCVFLLLSGTTRYVPPQAHIRVHQIWLGDRVEKALAANYTAQDLTIVERDIGRLAKFTSDMGGSGDLLELALSVPPWDALHEMTPDEMRVSHLVTTDLRPDALPPVGGAAMASMTVKPVQDRFVSDDVRHADASGLPAKTTLTAEATGGTSSER